MICIFLESSIQYLTTGNWNPVNEVTISMSLENTSSLGSWTLSGLCLTVPQHSCHGSVKAMSDVLMEMTAEFRPTGNVSGRTPCICALLCFTCLLVVFFHFILFCVFQAKSSYSPFTKPRGRWEDAHINLEGTHVNPEDTRVNSEGTHVNTKDTCANPKAHVLTLKTHVLTLKTHMLTLKAYMSTLKAHILTLKAHMLSLKAHMPTLKATFISISVLLQQGENKLTAIPNKSFLSSPDAMSLFLPEYPVLIILPQRSSQPGLQWLHVLNLTDRVDALPAGLKEPSLSHLGEAGCLRPVYKCLHKMQLQSFVWEWATWSQVCLLKHNASFARMVLESPFTPSPSQIHFSPINNYTGWWLDHDSHHAPTCRRCLPWWIFVKKQNTTFIEINKRLRWQSDLLSMEEAHFSLTTATATGKDVFLAWVFGKVKRSRDSFIKSKESD